MICANVLPLQHTRIPWGWKNKTIDGGISGTETYVIEPKGDLQMPALCSYFNWDQFLVEGYPSAAKLGTRNYKSVFTTGCRLLGTERLLEEQPDLSGIAIQYLAWNTMLYDRWRSALELFFIGDDFAGNQGLFMSPAIWRSWLKKHYRAMIHLAKTYASTVIFHSDGDIYDILEDLQEMGVDWVSYEPVGRMKTIKSFHLGMLMIPVEDQKQKHENSMRLQR